MNIQVSAFLTHKLKETLDDCFDRYALGPKSDRFIVADGVSNSFFPGIWTELLCQAFIEYQEGDFNPSDPKCNEFINGYRRKWKEEVSRIANRPDAKFFTKRLFFQGNTAACAYVGCHFTWDSRYAIQTFALGDCCLFVFTDDKSPHKLLFSSLKDNYVFNNFPHYVDSKQDESYGATVIESFELPDTGLIIMASDALSKWIFENHEGEDFERLIRLGSQEEFINWVAEYRQSAEHPLENDDIVLFRIAFSSSMEQNLVVEQGSVFVIPTPQAPDQPPIETGAMTDEPTIVPEAILVDGPEPEPLVSDQPSIESDAALDEPTNIPEAKSDDGPKPAINFENPNDDYRESASSESIAFPDEIIVKSDPLLFQEITPTPVVETVRPDTRNVLNRITERTIDILETDKEDNLAVAFTEIIRHGIKDIVTTIRAVVDYPLDDRGKMKLIKALLEADTNKNKQN